MSKDNYSKIVAELRSIVNQLQDDSTSIDQLPALLKRAKLLITKSKQKLRDIESDISGLFEDEEE